MKTLPRRFWLTCFVGVIALPSSIVAAQAASGGGTDIGPGLVSSLRIVPAATADGAPAVRFTLRNTCARTVDVLAWDLPGQRAAGNLLTVTRDGAAVAFRGRLVKHAAPGAADYVHLAPGASYTTTVDLAADYDLCRPGTYSVRLASESNIGAELTGKVVTFDCSRPANFMAYVQPDDPYTIYICSGYWPAPALGYDSKAGTLVHESSHFLVNGGAADVVYGLAGGRQLASTRPNSAVRNADNIEHFTESL